MKEQLDYWNSLSKEQQEELLKNMSPEELERLANDPLIRNLQYQIQHGVQDIKLETNQGEHKMKNIVVPEGANQE